jgi:NAD(P)-dependent dehydrogenase (short-subunit alcohol dehydrogenase family)
VTSKRGANGERPVALVTGGAQGLGRATAERLLDDGWNVVLVDVDRDAGLETTEELGLSIDLNAGFEAGSPIGRDGVRVSFVHADVGVEADAQRFVEEALDTHGRLDGLVCNAGVSRFEPLDTLSLAGWNAILGTNLTGAFLSAKYAAPYLRQCRGAIVTIASTRALMSEPHGEAYAASKGGLVALTHALAVSLGPEVRVNCISPGWIDVSQLRKSTARVPQRLSRADHEQHPAGRVGRPEDIAAAVAWLLGDESGFVTGANLVIDGGMTRRMIYVPDTGGVAG